MSTRQHPARVAICGLCSRGYCDEHYIEWLESENARLREEIEQWRKEAQFKEDERVRLREALEKIEEVQPETLAMLRREGFKFEIRLDLTDGWEKLAFTLYSTICEVDAIARNALKEMT